MKHFWLRVLGDLATTLTVSSLKNKQQRAEYIEGLLDLIPDLEDDSTTTSLPTGENNAEGAPSKESGSGQSSSGTSTSAQTGGGAKNTSATPSFSTGSSSSEKNTPKQNRASNQRARPMRLFYGLRLVNVGPKAKDVLREAQRIELNGFPNAGAALIRIVVELVVGEAIERLQWEASMDLRSRINACLSKLDPTNKSDRYLSVRRAMSDRDNLFSMRSMQGYLHNPLLPAEPVGLRALSEAYATLLEDLDSELESAP